MPAAARILLADDHDIARQGIAALVATQPGWEVCGEARTGREAVAMAAGQKPDVIVMDVLMPDLNGLDAARQIRKAAPSVEIVILSGHQERKLIQAAFDAGIRAYVFKPEARTQLVPALAAALARKPYLTPQVSEILFGQADQGGEAALTPREREIIQLLAEGRSNKQVAAELDISAKTVETHRAAIMRKLNLAGLSELVLYAIRNKIIEP